MIIAAHCIIYQKKQQSYLLEVLLNLAAQQPQHHFILLTEIKIPLAENLKNIKCLLMQPAIKNKLSLQYWYRFKMPGILQKNTVNIFISEAGMLCKNLPIPQYLFLSPEKQQVAARKIDNFAFKYPKLFATQTSRATAIFFTEPFLANVIKNKPTVSYLVYHGLSKKFKPISFEEKESWLDTNKEGCDFFVFHVSETTKGQVLNMLKAFSIFKKWTESTMKLVLLLHTDFTKNDIPKFNLYKFREEVELVNFKEEASAAALYAAAFLHIYLPTSLADENFPLHALQTQTGLLTTDNESQKLRFGSAAAYCGLNHKSIAEKLLYYYKNDFEKDSLIAHATDLLKNYSLANSTAQIAASIGL